ncbi:MAG: RDD family protein [Bacilli bacterium]|nr:RDD family protein [Bacilli bacterium]
MENKELQYQKAGLARRIGAVVMDQFLLFFLTFILLAVSNSLMVQTPLYHSLIAKRETVQTASNLYAEDGTQIVSYLSSDTELSDRQRKDELAGRLKTFYANRDFASAEDEAAYTTRRLSYVYEGTNMFVVSEGTVTEAVDNPSVYWRFYKKDATDFAYKLVLTSPGYLDATRGVFLYFVVEALVCFTFSFSIFYVLLPLTAFRRGRRTLGKAVLKVGYLGADALNPSWKRYACYCLFLYGVIYLGSVVSFLIPLIVSVSMAFLSKRRQNLAEYVTNIYLVDNRSQEIYLDYGDYVVHTDERENATLENPDLRTKP